MMVLIIKMSLASFLASLGFGILFNIKGKNLILAGLTGVVGGVLYKCGLYFGLSELYANFIGSLGLAFCAEILARVCKTPVTTFIVCALIPLVPGGGMYRTMLAVVGSDVDGALAICLDTLSIAGVLALGILIVSTLVQLYFRTKKLVKMR